MSKVDTLYIEHHLRAAIGEWYAWLGARSSKLDEWLSVPAWCKRVPSRLDIPWALNDLEARVGNEHMMRVLFVIVDEVWLCCQEMEGVPDVSKLRNALKEVADG